MSNKTPRQLLVAALMHCKLAERTEQGFGFSIGRKVKQFSQADVMAYDARLPRVIDHTYAVDKYSCARLMRRTLHHWHSPGIADSSGVYITPPIRVLQGKAADEYEIRARRYEIEVIDGLEIVSTYSKRTHIPVTKDWLDEHYPGLTAKVDLLIALGINPLEASEQALFEQPGQNTTADMEEINFD